MSVRTFVAALILGVFFLSSAIATAQVVRPFATGLLGPMKIVAQPDGTLLVAEAGTGPNTGRISLIDRDGRRFTVIDGLPSGLHGRDPSGPSGVLLAGQRLFILIGSGDAAIAGPAPGSELPNPNPASPLLSSVLLVEFETETLPLGFSLPPSAQPRIARGEGIYTHNVDGQHVRVSRLVDFPDYVAEPRPDVPGNVRLSNPFGMIGSATHLDIVDASRNLVFSVEVSEPNPRTLTTFASVRSTLPMGPPFVDAVPSNIRAYGDSLLVPFLTGFPFGAGAASVQTVNRHTGTMSTTISGLQTAIDVLPNGPVGAPLYVLEFSSSLTTGAPGRLVRFDTPDARPTVIADGLMGPTSIAIDPRSGDVWASELFSGRVVRILVPR